MLKPLIRISLISTVIAVVASLSVPAAMAAGTWTVSGGTSFTATAAAGTTFTFSDTTSGLSITCSKGTLAGTVINETSGTTTAIGHITAGTLGTCSGPLGSTCTIQMKPGSTATMNVTSYNFTTKVVSGTITNIDLIVTCMTILGTCTAEAKGTAGVTYNDNNSLMAYTSSGDSMTIISTSGACAGILKVGDVVTLSSGTLGLILSGSPANPITVRQP